MFVTNEKFNEYSGVNEYKITEKNIVINSNHNV